MHRILLAVAVFAALLCVASAPEREERDAGEPGGGLRFSGGLAGRRLGARETLSTRIPAGPALPFAATRRPVRGGDVQVNDPGRDAVYAFPDANPPVAPLWLFNQSETSLVVRGQTVVVTYNDTAGVEFGLTGGAPRVTSWNVVGFSTSTNGGQSWRTGFLPGPPGGLTDVDNVVDVDRAGRFYAATLSDTGGTVYSVAVSHSEDGLTWSTPVVPEPGPADKPWMAVGPDPAQPSRDVVYVTWTKFLRTGAFLRLARSTDGGTTWTASTLSPPAPDPGPFQYTNPVVDSESGRLYVSYARTSAPSDVELVESDDGGVSFRRVSFSFAAEPARIAFLPPGDECSCAGSVFRALHAGPNLAPASSAPLYAQSWWIGAQPTLAARGDLLAIAWAAGSGARSDVLLSISRDRGATWSTPVHVNPDAGDGVQHVEPAVAIDSTTARVHVAYYVQHADETYDVDLGTLGPGDGYTKVATQRLTTRPSTIPPSNVDDGAGTRVNFDALWGPCYSQGHYMMLRAENGNVHAAWTDGRNTVTHPVNARDPLSGVTHAQSDVFYRRVRP